MANEIIDEDTCVAMDYRNLIKKPRHRPFCIKYLANEICRLSQRVGGRIEFIDTNFLPQNNIPENIRKYARYGRIFVDYLLPKDKL